jgi:hypothetical protein
MPRIEVGPLPLLEEQKDLVRGIVATRGKNKGRLRASKPKVTRHKVPADNAYGYTCRPDPVEGCTAYIWRMVAFFTSPVTQHKCMPCTAEFDLPYRGDERREMVRYLDKIVDVVVDSIPAEQWHGVIRWGQVFGQVGTPQYDEEGAVIYR